MEDLAGLLLYVIFTLNSNFPSILSRHNDSTVAPIQTKGNTIITPSRLQAIRFRNTLDPSVKAHIDSMNASTAQQTLFATFQEELTPFAQTGKFWLYKFLSADHPSLSNKQIDSIMKKVIERIRSDRLLTGIADDGAVLFENKSINFVTQTRLWFTTIQSTIFQWLHQEYETQRNTPAKQSASDMKQLHESIVNDINTASAGGKSDAVEEAVTPDLETRKSDAKRKYDQVDQETDGSNDEDNETERPKRLKL